MGGGEIIAYDIGRKLIEKGNNIVLVTFNFGEWKPYEEVDGIKIFRVHYKKGKIGFIVSQIRVFFKIVQLNRKYNFEILHQFFVFQVGFATLASKLLLKKPLVTSLVGWDTYDPYNPVSKMFNPYLALVMNYSDVITSPSHDLANHAKEQGCERGIEIIPHCIEINKFNLKNEGNTVRRKLGIKSGEIIVLSVQRLDPRKKLEYLIKAIPNVIKSNQNVRFVIVGKGSEMEKLLNLVSEVGVEKYVQFVGFVNDEELPAYYNAADIFVLHSSYEAFGIVLIEAMICELPVISTNVGAIPEVVDDKITGLIVPPKKPKELANAILELANSKELREKMGKEGKERAIRKYDLGIIIAKYLNIYESLRR